MRGSSKVGLIVAIVVVAAAAGGYFAFSGGDSGSTATSSRAGSPMGGPMGGPPGQGGQGNRPRFDFRAMEDFNPLNPPKDSPMYERAKKRYDELFAALEKKAK